MKKLCRSAMGKTIIFISCLITLCFTILCVAGQCIMYLDRDNNFYTHSEEDIKNSFVNAQLKGYGYQIVESSLYPDYNYNDDEVSYKLEDYNGNTILQSQDYNPEQQYSTLHFYAQTEDNPYGYGVIYDVDSNYLDQENSYILQIKPVVGSNLDDELTFIVHFVSFMYGIRYSIFLYGFVSLILTILLFVALMSVSARTDETDEIVAGPLNPIPFDLLCVLYVLVDWLIIAVSAEIFTFEYSMIAIYPLVIAFFLTVAGLLGLCMSLASRIKQHNLWSNTVICRVWMLIKKIILSLLMAIKKLWIGTKNLFMSIPLVKRTIVVIAIIVFIELLVILNSWTISDVLIPYVISRVIIIPLVLYFLIGLKKLQDYGEKLSQGDFESKIDTQYLVGDLKKHGENLNNISSGVALAVEKQLKSERMKTELITNVSHDIKTPLTSIINYATLIKAQNTDNEKINEYSDVLIRQSNKLKRLLEDLVEASKASTGNLEVCLVECDASVFLSQVSGEYQERLDSNELTLVVSESQEEIRIMADGRRMWRIFDNLMNNICKYSQKGTRVYLSLQKQGDKAVFTFKNTSSAQLNMSEDELMERFTRGDSSRNTEGNGLGLSIAKSMAKLQNGDLSLVIDGDLFKAILTFPIVK